MNSKIPNYFTKYDKCIFCVFNIRFTNLTICGISTFDSFGKSDGVTRKQTNIILLVGSKTMNVNDGLKQREIDMVEY